MTTKRVCPKCRKSNFWEKRQPNLITWKCLTEGCGYRLQKFYRKKGG